MGARQSKNLRASNEGPQRSHQALSQKITSNSWGYGGRRFLWFFLL